ncbi:AAA family ATPase [Hazenella sp. IB182357]|uniref:AAA family ATPase n=1 Tax=Polycladospora coralii TaxID=2771432 RepID=A0A926NGJ2_9BACL|nr:AAA family ATPase [Polycladospora coralii]MBD1372933.1 AAA family ATPase [Polycladospora coralii]MBS7531010.1 AAA family ATPase [Polycladospora coralii]
MSRRVMAGTSKHQIHVVFEQNKEATCSMRDSVWTDTGIEQEALHACFTSLNQLVGIDQVKKFIKEIYAWLEIGKRRREAGLLTEQQVLHMIFTGNPGTGKTTVARILSTLLKEMGVLSKGHLVEVERADLVGEYIGHTAQKTREHVQKALGGILFIDEAYSLARGGDKDFGREAIDTMVKAMEDFKNEFVLILAGYSNEMECFLNTNPGLPSRFPIQLRFPNFDLEQLMQITMQMVGEREYCLSSSANNKIRIHLRKQMDGNFGNARYIRNMIEQAIRQHAVRILRHPGPSRSELMTLRGEDFQFESLKEKNKVPTWYN